MSRGKSEGFKHVMMHFKRLRHIQISGYGQLQSRLLNGCELQTLTLVALSFFSHCTLSFSISVTLNRRSVTSWYKPWGGKQNSH